VDGTVQTKREMIVDCESIIRGVRKRRIFASKRAKNSRLLVREPATISLSLSLSRAYACRQSGPHARSAKAKRLRLARAVKSSFCSSVSRTREKPARLFDRPGRRFGPTERNGRETCRAIPRSAIFARLIWTANANTDDNAHRRFARLVDYSLGVIVDRVQDVISTMEMRTTVEEGRDRNWSQNWLVNKTVGQEKDARSSWAV